MKRIIIALAFSLASISFAHAQAPALTNFGFESPSLGSGFQYNPTGTGWTFTGLSGISGNGSGFTSANPGAPQGTQIGFLQGTGFFSQSFTSAAPLTGFSVSFFAAQRSAGTTQASSQTFTVSVDATVLGTFTPSSTSYNTLSTNAVFLSGGTHTLTFTGTNPNGGDNTAFVDNIQLSGVVVPESGTVTLLGAVLPLIGTLVVLRRKTRSK